MKIWVLFLLMISIVVNEVFCQQPLKSDAGVDSVLCNEILAGNAIQIGGNPSASGGKGNYQYSWDIYPKPYEYLGSTYWASDMLSSTTVANPTLKPFLPMNEEGPIYFILTVSDSIGSIARDTTEYYWIQWGAMVLGNFVKETFPGDTQTIRPMPFGGGIPPYTFDWGDSDSIIGGRYDFNVYLNTGYPTRKVIIPQSPSLKWYDILITDSVGCTLNQGSYEGFLINSVSIEKQFDHELLLFPNPTSDKCQISLSSQKLIKVQLFDLQGKELTIRKIDQVNEHSLRLDLLNQEEGLYFLIIETEAGLLTEKLFIER